MYILTYLVHSKTYYFIIKFFQRKLQNTGFCCKMVTPSPPSASFLYVALTQFIVTLSYFIKYIHLSLHIFILLFIYKYIHIYLSCIYVYECLSLFIYLNINISSISPHIFLASFINLSIHAFISIWCERIWVFEKWMYYFSCMELLGWVVN